MQKGIIVLLLWVSILLGPGNAHAFLFGENQGNSNSSLEVVLSGVTTWGEGGAAQVELDAQTTNRSPEQFEGELRLIVMVMNGQIDFEKVLIISTTDLSAGANKGFISEALSLAGNSSTKRAFRITMPTGSQGNIIQVMAVIFGKTQGEAPPPVISRAVYQLPKM